MINKEDILSHLREKKDDFFAEYQLVKLGLFGSFARDEASEESDIDLIVEFKPDTPNLADKKSAMKSSIEKHFHRKVSLCREKYIKPYFKSQILQSTIYV